MSQFFSWFRFSTSKASNSESDATQPAMGRRRKARRSSASQFELLESRTLLTTFTVLNTNDSGEGSLRQAILDANNQAGRDTIEFNISAEDTTIHVLTGLPIVRDTVTIDGSTQPGYTAGSPVVVISGDLLPDQTYLSGLTLNTADSLIKGLVINGFDEGSGIEIGGYDSTGVTGNHVEGCIIGLNAAGDTSVRNSDGISIKHGASNNVIGGIGIAGNVISGNQFGIDVGDVGTANNVIQGNAIGTSKDRTVAIGNGYGIALGIGTTGTLIGGSAAGQGNLISGNENIGIYINGASAAQNTIQGNRIGTNAAGTAALGHFTTSAGIALATGTHDNQIGGTNPGEGNVIAGVQGDGILITDPETHGNTVQGNLIGVSADGTVGIQNRDDGIAIVQSPGNQIGGDGPAARNVISNSGRHGISVFGTNAAHNTIQGNYIGTNAAGTAAIANGSDGIRVDGAQFTTIGGTTAGLANLLSGNNENGITVSGADTASTTIQGNRIGVASDGQAPIPNAVNGIQVDGGAQLTLIGGTTSAEWNLIAFNHFNGIDISGATTGRATVTGNSIYGNEGTQLDLGANNVTPNDDGDADTGPNGLQNFPVLTSANAGAAKTFITGSLNSLSNHSYTLNFYSSPSTDVNLHGQAQTLLGQLQVSTDNSGNAPFSVIFAFVNPGQVITATATDDAGNTSEISAAVVIGTDIPRNPSLEMPGRSLSYQLHQAPVVIDATASVTDPDSQNFGSGNLTVVLNSKGEKGEKVSVRNQGLGEAQIGIKGSKITFEGTLIGKLKGGSGKKPLTVTFTSAATINAVTALVQNITYAHNGKQTALTTRTLQFRVTDEAGHVSNLVNKLIDITVPSMTS